MHTIVYWLSKIMIFTIPCEGIVVLPGLGTMSRGIGLLAGLCWILKIIFTNGGCKITSFHISVLLFILWNSISILWSIDSSLTMERTISYWQMAGLMMIIQDVYTTPTMIRSGMQTYVLGLYIPMISTITSFMAGSQTSYGRYAAVGEANGTAIVIALGIPFAWYLATSANTSIKGQIQSLVNYVYIPVALFAISLTATRSALVVILPVLILVSRTIFQLGLMSYILVFAFLLGSLFMLPSLIPESSMQRLGTVDDELSTGDLNGRMGFWKEGLELWAAHPIIGVGSGTFQRAVESGRSAHNSFIAILTELGIIGFVFFGMIWVIAVSLARHQPKGESIFWLTVLGVLLLANLPLNLAHTKRTWLLLCLLAASASAAYQPYAPRSGLQASKRTIVPAL